MTSEDIKEESLGIKMKDGPLKEAFLSNPDDGLKHPGIIVIQEIWGLTDFIRTVCRKLSKKGYTAIAPNLYSRKEQKELLTEENLMDAMRQFWTLPLEKRRDPEAIREMISKMPETPRKVAGMIVAERQGMEVQMLSDLESVYQFVMETHKPGKIGVVGFCLGGGLAFQLSTQKPFDASVIFYGASPRNISDLSGIRGKVLAIYAGQDENINSGLPSLLENVIRYGTDFEMKIYPGTNHAFYNHTGMSYNEPASRDAEELMDLFFRKNLGE